jgi:hypothetical protein
MAEAVILILVIPIILMAALLELWHIRKVERQLRARAAQKPLTAYDVHRQRWEESGDPAELGRMYDEYTGE